MSDTDISVRDVVVMVQYLAINGRHKDLVLKELSDFIDTIAISDRIAKYILGTGEPTLIKQIINHPHRVDLGEMLDYNGMPACIFNFVEFQKIRSETRCETFDLILPFVKNDDLKLGIKLVRQAIDAGDPVFLKHILDTFPQHDRTDLLLSPRLGCNLSPNALMVWETIFAHIDPACGELDAFANDVVRTQNPHGVALLMKAGYPIKPALENNTLSGNTWTMRLLRRVSSGHDMLTLYATLPDAQEIKDMDAKEVQRLLAGPSPKEIKAEKNRAQYAKWRAHKEKMKAL